ncbi:OX-2 membrane glycoprotein [Fundulus heteroclitus]|uniref:OX-2 membrane glycoprotein n=1 Tax=Fundulus heteroclitus TaxID=8078 RepID=UPI00165C27C4|nr:OX-2 membrane glycoprotein [Fundulus heteroclitus]
MYLILIIVSLAFEAQASDISSHGTTTVMYGEEARFTCTLADPTGVLQVTWQRGLKPELLENLATYSKRFGEQINSPFAKKVSFNESSLSSSSIVLKNVTWEDENCYVCSFNAYPEGSKRKQICLKVEGIVSTLVSTSNSTTKSGQKVLSCSATGKPAPTVDWDIPPNITRVLQPTAEVSHSNGTFTSSSSITVDKDWTGRVECVLNKGKNGERREELILPAQPEPGPVEGKRSQMALIISALSILICVIAVATVVIHKRLKKSADRFTAV